ncbi:unnamed protein product [Hermetia illucens]|uniref:Odorant receptor n=1 Tax=Hermetia illucens TaxID=343691 RepID=A0A7R8YZV1_HERIL|nr:odorant receptor 33b-like [Hermetia illucens]CAD7088126.1 unnamed protein product [Hermetia illucens]
MEKIGTSDALDFVWFGWMLVGVYPIQKYNIRHVCHLIVAAFATNFYAAFMYITQLFFVNDIKSLLNNLPMNVLVLITGFKLITVLWKRSEILAIKYSLAKLDERLLTKEHAENLVNATKFSYRFFVIGFLVYDSVNIMTVIIAAFSNQQRLLYEIWLPYDWQATALRYWFTLFYQFAMHSFLSMQSISSDFCGPIYIMILIAHLQNIMNRIENLKYDPRKSESENLKGLIECIEDHRIISEIFNTLQGTVSHIILYQFVATALVIVMIALEYLLFSPNMTEVIALIGFLMGEIAQILPCCYYSNKFLSTTDSIVTSIYSCPWYDQTSKFKKIMIIFMQMTQKGKVIVAGKVIPVTMATFTSIIKFSYSLLMVVQRIQR